MIDDPLGNNFIENPESLPSLITAADYSCLLSPRRDLETSLYVTKISRTVGYSPLEVDNLNREDLVYLTLRRS